MRVLYLLLIAYALWLGFLYFNQDGLLYPGAFANLADETPRYPNVGGYESVWIEADAGVRVEGWFVRGDACTAEKPGPAVILTHGNYEVIDDGSWHAEEYRRMGISVLLAEYRGYGRSLGKPTEAGITRDMVAFFDWLAKQPEIDPNRIILHGRSIGGAAVAQLAARRAAAALILQSSFRSAASMTSGYFAPSFLLRDSWRTDTVVKKIQIPLLLLHGRSDRLIPPSHSEALAALHPRATLKLMDGSHNFFPANREEYWGEIRSFLNRAGLLPISR